ncbi:hypothetical protein SERLA73DRAFT_109335 [Serpula lacrymans var. lacrymans S7.3]|uniref:DNA damage-binding protein 1 n=2 Tax=Serpula lacrymans var. lacrymans TaxID=341189 RepID=F8Q146_SERL3|nr:uncharacterized protein SERLADRAFT_449959 [Serpula lacrymans var. lacrymans S7.9]EGN98024.1 hypothetical protein SERLA73DRAFT_109335 [Serpula lacrymans var. lacrymans S7.3]EGO23614.1 hypothetical protein SERLADRAFT_449959 [Serpula lacrymans var. lacrymans S7.9]
MKVVNTFHPSSSVLDSLRCHLTGKTDTDYLVVANLNRIHISSVQPDGLRHECRFEVWGRVGAIKAVPSENKQCMTILVLTDHPDPELIFLSYQASQSGGLDLIYTKHLSLLERGARFAEFFNNVLVDPTGRLAVVSPYTGKLKIVLITPEGTYDTDFDVSIAELNLLALEFISSEPDLYTLAIMHIDHLKRLQLLSRDISLDEYQLSPTPSPALPSTPLSAKSFPIGDKPPSLVYIPPFIDDDEDFIGGMLVIGGTKILFYDTSSRESQGNRKQKQRRMDKGKDSTVKELAKAKQKEDEREWRKKKARASVDWPWSEITAWCAVGDELGRSFLIGDKYGRLAMLSIGINEGTTLTLVALGETSSATTLTYLTSQVLYVGSHFGDSQLLRINTTPVQSLESPTLPVPSDINTTTSSSLAAKGKMEESSDRSGGCIINGRGSFLSVIESYKNIAPIIDAALVDVDNSGQHAVVTCSGGQNTGSISIVRNGADFKAMANMEGIVDVTNIWPLRANYYDTVDTHVAVSTFKATHILSFDGRNVASHVNPVSKGFITTSPTLVIANVLGRPKAPGQATNSYVDSSLVVQITSRGIALLEYAVELGEYARVGDIWTPAKLSSTNGPGWENREIVAASANGSQFVLALNSGRIVLLNLDDRNCFDCLNWRDLDGSSNYPTEISAISCVPLNPSKKFSMYIVVSFWSSNHIEILSANAASHFASICKTPVLPSLPRSLLLFNFTRSDIPKQTEYNQYLIVGLGDGSVVSYEFKKEELHGQKIFSVGNVPVTLHPCDVEGRRTVFACGSRTSILFWDKERLHHSPLMLNEVSAVSRLNTTVFDSSVILATSTGLVIGSVKNLDKLYIRSIPLGYDNPRRILHVPSLRAYAVGCISITPTRIDKAEYTSSSMQLFDHTTFARLGQFRCDPNEEITALGVVSVTLERSIGTYICAGTYKYVDEVEPSQGRLLVFDAEDGSLLREKITMAVSLEVRGCVYAVGSVNGMIIAAINSSVVVYRPEIDASTQLLALHKITEWNHNYLVTNLVCRGDKILVGDAINSISFLRMVESQIQCLARDYGSLWPVCVEMLDQSSIIGANSDYNLFTFALQETELRKSLERDGSYYIGDMVNKFIPGALTAHDVSVDMPLEPKQLFFTSTGCIGVIVDMGDELSLHMTALQRNMSTYLSQTKGVTHTKFRAPKNAYGRSDAEATSFGFLDGDFLEKFMQFLNDPGPLKSIMDGQGEAERLTISVDRIHRVLERLQSMH